MPWKVTKRAGCPANKPFAVVKKDNNKIVACHESEEKANAQLKALYAAEEKA